jgi:hypothetical protein
MGAKSFHDHELIIVEQSMHAKIMATSLGIGLLLATGAWAQPPANVTAVCKDGSNFTGASRSGACRGHGGVATWGSGAVPAAGQSGGAATAPAPSAANPPPAPGGRATAPAAAGGGAGQVWVNTNTKVYHCQGDRYYGKTKAGTYMSESAAKAAGDRPAGGKACS